jgi:hypothetical protein
MWRVKIFWGVTERGHVQRSSICRLRLDLFAKNTLLWPGDGVLVASRDDGEGPCSEAESSARAALYDVVFLNWRLARIPRGRSLILVWARAGWCCAPKSEAATVAEMFAPSFVVVAQRWKHIWRAGPFQVPSDEIPDACQNLLVMYLLF